jgi:hypothetical protein
MIPCAHRRRSCLDLESATRPNAAAFGSRKPHHRETGKVGQVSAFPQLS